MTFFLEVAPEADDAFMDSVRELGHIVQLPTLTTTQLTIQTNRGKTEVLTEHKKHYRTLEWSKNGLGKPPVG